MRQCHNGRMPIESSSAREPPSPDHEITVRINSPSGIVTEAIAIRTALMKHPAVKSIEIEGCCDSAATLIACLPGAKVRMAKGGEYMIHRCSAGAWGQADRILSVYNSMVSTDKDMADIYAERTGKTSEECLELMKAETWFTAEEAVEAGFVDEIITSQEEDVPMVACAVDAASMEVMRECYAHVPDRMIRGEKETGPEPGTNVSNEISAVAADSSTENKNGGVSNMDELRNATAEQLQTENPALAQSIATDAVAAERKRVADINKLTRKGEKWQEMARKAIEEGTSAADFLAAVIEEEARMGAAYLENRSEEGNQARKVGGGDAGDHDDGDLEAKRNKEAKLLAELADGIDDSTIAMA